MVTVFTSLITNIVFENLAILNKKLMNLNIGHIHKFFTFIKQVQYIINNFYIYYKNPNYYISNYLKANKKT